MKTQVSKRREHPLFIRLSHWLNFVALAIMVTSGLRIYNASPLWSFKIPDTLTLGGWLAGARQWHFFAMWILAVNGLSYVAYNILTKHGRRTTLFGKTDVTGVMPMILYYLRIRKVHPPQQKYNALQKLAYTTIPFAGIGSIMSGIAIYWPVQFSGITSLFGGYEYARMFHFFCTAVFVLFTSGHLFMVVISGWDNFLSMITGWKRTIRTNPTEVQS